jgi:hypothetical protein
MSLRRFAILLFAFLACSTLSHAQKADASFVVGAAFSTQDNSSVAITCTIPCPPGFHFSNDNHVFYEGTGAVRLANLRLVSLHLEVPVAAIPSAQVVFPSTSPLTPLKLTSLFVTPSLRVKLAPGSSVSPFFSIGGGWAHYKVGSGPTDNRGALQFGGGVDFKTGIPLLGFRAEVRDFLTGQPNFGTFSVRTGTQNVLAGGGIVLRF